MDFLTFFPYIGILVLICINAWLVLKRKIYLNEEKDQGEE